MNSKTIMIAMVCLIVSIVISGCNYSQSRNSSYSGNSQSKPASARTSTCPTVDEFTPADVVAEMVRYESPGYPRLAEQAGLEGLVWIKVLVTESGWVQDAFVYKSSGTPSLDEAALAVAPKNQFKSGQKDGQPICMWVTYKVEFKLAPSQL
jgi:protein TonB